MKDSIAVCRESHVIAAVWPRRRHGVHSISDDERFDERIQ